MHRNDFEKYDFNHSIQKDWVFPYSQVDKGSKVIIYGAGDVGQSYIIQLERNSFCEVVCWVDNAYKRYREFGLNVEAPSAIKIIAEYDFVVLAVANKHMAMEINSSLLAMNVSQDRIIWNDDERFYFNGTLLEKRLSEQIVENYFRVFPKGRDDYSYEEQDRLKEKLVTIVKQPDGMVIPRLVVELTTACSLKCKACNNLMFMYKCPKHVSVDEVISDLSTVAKCVDIIEIMELIGGEPFLYPELIDVVEKAISFKNVLLVEITTNGTIVPSEDVINTLRNPKVTIRISRYPEARNLDKLRKIFDDTGIRYDVLDVVWTDSGSTDKRFRTSWDIRNRYWKCPSAYNCKTLLRGKVFQCARAASLYDLGIDDGDVSFLELCESKDLKQDIKRFWLKTSDGACDHCDCTDYWRVIKPGV